jgi:hypothetical protein
VDEPGRVGRIQSMGHFGCDPDRIFDRELALPVDPVPQRLAVHERHDIIQEPIGLPGVEELQDVRMLEAGGRADFGQESLRSDGNRKFGPEHFDGHAAPVS